MRFSRKVKKDRVIIQKIIPIIFSLIIIFLIIFLSISNFKIYQRRAVLRDQIKERESEITELSQRIKDMKEAEGEKFDDDFILEKIAREQLLLKKRGEEVIFITTPEREKEETIEGEEGEAWSSFKGFLKNISEKIVNFLEK